MAHQATGLTRVSPFPEIRSEVPRKEDSGVARSARTRSSPVVGLVSGKGGVGKSTLAANLAVSCARLAPDVLLIDGDEGLANADLLLGLVPRAELSDWCAGDARLADLRSEGPHGLELLSVGTGASAVQALNASLVGQARNLANAIDSPFVSPLAEFLDSRRLSILDLGAGIGEAVVSLALRCDPVWLVVTPEPTSLADAYTTARRLWIQAPTLRIEVVVNRASDLETGTRTHLALDRLSRRFLSRGLPLRSVLIEDPAMGAAVALQEPVVTRFPDTPIARRISLLAESLLED